MQATVTSQVTLEYPPGYNPNRRRGSVSAEPPSKYSKTKLNSIPKTSEAKQRIKSTLNKNILFKHLDDDELEKVVDVMFEKKVNPGDVVIKQGDDGDNFYVIDKGDLDIYRDGKYLTTLTAGRYFGELALMYNVPRAATVQSKTEAILWCMDRVAFRAILMEYSIRKRLLYEQFLENVPILATLTPYERATIADALEPCKFEDGDVIIRQGESGDIFYIIEQGEVVVTQSRSIYGNTYGKPIELLRLSRGHYFGEIALLTNRPRAANVIAVGAVKCLALNRKDFTQLMGTCEEILKRNMDAYKSYEDILTEQQQQLSQQSSAHESDSLSASSSNNNSPVSSPTTR